MALGGHAWPVWPPKAPASPLIYHSNRQAAEALLAELKTGPQARSEADPSRRSRFPSHHQIVDPLFEEWGPR